MPDPERIAVMRTDRIGEVLLSTVAVDALKCRYPGAKVSFVTSEYSRPLIEDRDDIEEVITADTMSGRSTIRAAVHLAAELKPGRFDIAVVLNPHKLLHLACFLARIPVRAGYDRKWGVFLNRKIKDKRDEGGKHEIEYTMDLLNLLGIEGKKPFPELRATPRARQAVEKVLGEKGIGPSSGIVAVHPGSSNPAKIWPGGRYAEVIKGIRGRTGYEVCLIGSAEEKELAGGIIASSGVRALNLAGELDLKELAAFLEKCALFVGNDTGPMHMAAALRVPVIAIFGRNIPGVSPRRWGPVGEKNTVFHEDPGCDPCLDADCPFDYKCLKAITSEKVLEAALDELAKGRRQKAKG